MAYMQSNAGTQIPKAFKKDKAVMKAKASKGKLLYLKQIKAAKKGK